MSLTPTVDLAQLAAWLADARAAYHALMTGRAAVEVAVDGAAQVTRFDRINADKLQAYIARLEGQIRSAGRAGCVGAIGIRFT